MTLLVPDDFFPASDHGHGPAKFSDSGPLTPLQMLFSILKVLCFTFVDAAIWSAARAADIVLNFVWLVVASASNLANFSDSAKVGGGTSSNANFFSLVDVLVNASLVEVPRFRLDFNSADAERLGEDAGAGVAAVSLGADAANASALVNMTSPSRAVLAWLELSGDHRDADSEEHLLVLAITFVALTALFFMVWLRYKKYFVAIERLTEQHQLYFQQCAETGTSQRPRPPQPQADAEATSTMEAQSRGDAVLPAAEHRGSRAALHLSADLHLTPACSANSSAGPSPLKLPVGEARSTLYT